MKSIFCSSWYAMHVNVVFLINGLLYTQKTKKKIQLSNSINSQAHLSYWYKKISSCVQYLIMYFVDHINSIYIWIQSKIKKPTTIAFKHIRFLFDFPSFSFSFYIYIYIYIVFITNFFFCAVAVAVLVRLFHFATLLYQETENNL